MMAEDLGRKDSNYTKVLNQSLKVFFKDALRITLTNPLQAYSFYRTIKWQTKAARIRSRLKHQGYHIPPIMIFSITNECNLQCKWCYAQILHPSPNKEMSTDKVQSVIEEAREIGISFIVLAGGEPFLRREILDITENFPQIIFLIFTNGLLIDEGIIRKLKKQKHVVPLVSLEGYQEDTDERRGQGIYENVQTIIESMKRNGIFFGTSLTITRPTFATLTSYEFVRKLIDAGCRFLLFLEYTPIKEGTEDLVLTDEQRARLMSLLDSFHSKWPALFIAVPGHEAEIGGCLAAGRGFVHINAEGDIEPCPFAPFSDANVRDSSLKEALQSELLKVIRQYPEELVVTAGGCVLWKKREWVRSLFHEAEKRE